MNRLHWYNVPSIVYRNDEEWKKLRTAIGKQTLPQNVNSYITGMSNSLQRFTHYLRANRDEKGYLEDIFELLNKLLMECKPLWISAALYSRMSRVYIRNG